MKIGISASKRTIFGKKKDADRSGIGTRTTGTARSSSISGNKTSNCPLLRIALIAMVMIGTTDLIGSIRTMIGGLKGRLGEECQFMIGWGADSVCTTSLVIVPGIFLGTKRNLRRWPMHGFSISSYFAEMPIPIVGYFKCKQKNPQAHGYRCSFHPGVFQSINFPQGT